MAGSVEPRTLKQGSKEWVVALVTEENGQNISADTFKISHVPDVGKATQPGAWEDPDPAESGPGATTAERRLAKLITGTLINAARTKYRVFAKITDSPEDIIVDCGTYTILV